MTPSNKVFRRTRFALLFSLASMPMISPSAVRADYSKVPPAYFPNLVEKASTPEGFVQPGLRLEKVAIGDLNGDTIPDLAMVLKMDNTANVLKDPDDAEREPLDTNPRMVAVALAGKGGQGYTLYTVNMNLIPRVEEPNMNDPFVDLKIDRGAMRVLLDQSSNAGSWSSSNITFVFRKSPQEMSLIGYDRTDVNRSSGELTETSVNFVTGKQQISTGSVSSDKKSTKLTQLPKRPLQSMGMIGDGFSFDPLNP
ncbi:MAG TPA: hypothetical protein VN367_00690 [Chlorobaculum sp.]|nr:hypothetical protein [Chlorobaculum sp.]